MFNLLLLNIISTTANTILNLIIFGEITHEFILTAGGFTIGSFAYYFISRERDT